MLFSLSTLACRTLANRLFLVFFFSTFSDLSHGQGPATRVQVSAALQSPSCRSTLTRVVPAVERGLLRLNARNASVYLGEYSELEERLVTAGLSQNRAREMADAVNQLHGQAFEFPALRFAADVFSSLVDAKGVLVCVASKNCSLAQFAENHLLFTEYGREAILILPPPTVSPRHFAINFIGTFSALAGERFLMQWLREAHELESRSPGASDRFYQTYARANRGALQPTPESLDSGFAVTFMSLYQSYHSAELFNLTFPEQVSANEVHLARATFRDLTTGRNSGLTAPMINTLGIRPDNFFERFKEILNAMSGTLRANQQRN